ncbi:MAG: hypothetical protein EOS28_29915 [Mesorhizobium sp.]|nr:MAG: hypothetical protein EOS28_29915 [Mesorhizobium sp.]
MVDLKRQAPQNCTPAFAKKLEVIRLGNLDAGNSRSRRNRAAESLTLRIIEPGAAVDKNLLRRLAVPTDVAVSAAADDLRSFSLER